MTRQGLPALTGVRAVACGWVMLSHFVRGRDLALPGWLVHAGNTGVLGVDLFFVLSGFILVRVHPDMTLQAASVVPFAIKRIFRVYPLSLAIILFMAADAWRHHWLGSAWYAAWKLPYVAAMIEPFFVRPPIVGWLATNWSVGIELLCYLAFPAFVVAFRGAGRGRLVAAIVLAAGAEALTQHWFFGAFYGVGAVLRGVCGFFLGALCALWTMMSAPVRRRTAASVTAGAVAAIVVLVGAGRLWPVPLAMAALITALSWQDDPVAAVLSARPIVWLGEISYSLYLVHGVFLGSYGWVWLAQARQGWNSQAVPWLWAIATLSTIIAISAFTFTFVEEPCRRFGNRLAARTESAFLNPDTLERRKFFGSFFQKRTKITR